MQDLSLCRTEKRTNREPTSRRMNSTEIISKPFGITNSHFFPLRKDAKGTVELGIENRIYIYWGKERISIFSFHIDTSKVLSHVCIYRNFSGIGMRCFLNFIPVFRRSAYLFCEVVTALVGGTCSAKIAFRSGEKFLDTAMYRWFFSHFLVKYLNILLLLQTGSIFWHI